MQNDSLKNLTNQILDPSGSRYFGRAFDCIEEIIYHITLVLYFRYS
jgi:hypothetical protein